MNQNARNQRFRGRNDRDHNQNGNLPIRQENLEKPKCPSQPDFENGFPRKIVINQRLGEEAKIQIKKTFAGLDVYLNDRIAHSHPLGAYLRSHFEKAMHSLVKGYAIGQNVGHNLARHMRNERDYMFMTKNELQQDIADKSYNSSYALKAGLYEDLSDCHIQGHWVKKWWSDYEHAMCPIVGPYDQVRHQNWLSSIASDTDLITFNRQIPVNWCQCRGGPRIQMDGRDPQTGAQWVSDIIEDYEMNRCDQCKRHYEYSISSDSIYYDGVYEEHEFRLIEDNAVVYFVFNDYDYAISQNKLSGKYVDDEGVWEYDQSLAQVNVQVKGNPIQYIHGVVRTNGKDSWVLKSRYPGYFCMIDTHSMFMNGDVPVRLCRMTKIFSPKCYADNVSPIDGSIVDCNFFKLSKTVYKDIIITAGDVRYEIDVQETVGKVKSSMDKMFDCIIENFKSRNEELVYNSETKMVTLRRWRVNVLGCKYQLSPITAKAEDVAFVVGRTIGMTKTQTVIMGFKKVKNEVEQLLKDPTSNFYTPDPFDQLIRYHELCKAYQIGDIISAVWTIDIGQNHIYSYAKELMGMTLEGVRLTFANYVRWVCVNGSLKTVFLLMLFLVLFYGFRFVNSLFNSLFAAASPGFNEVGSWLDDLIGPAFAAGLVTLGAKRKLDVKSKPFELPSVCVRDYDRLNLEKLKGCYDPKWKIRSTDWSKDFRNLVCNACNKPGALQCFPMIQHPLFATACVCHSCYRTMAASAGRHTSNKLEPDSEKWKKFETWFIDTVIPEFLQGFDDQIYEITIDDWLVKYPLKYQEEMRRVMERPGWDDITHYTYDAFPKIELQVTDVPYELMDTAANGVKERQICGPPAEKKILLNPIINVFEKVASKCQRGYCGSATTVDIGDKLTTIDWDVCFKTYFSLDGSAFDNTQKWKANFLIYLMLYAALRHKNVILKAPLTVEGALKIMLDSLILDVNVGRGDVNYKADARASGDGWTTWGNTELMRAYVWFTMEEAGVEFENWRGLFKGDDVIGAISWIDKWFVQDAFDKLWAKKNEAIKYGIGQIAKFIKFGPLEEHDFLSCDLFLDEYSRVTLVNKPKNILQKIWLTTKYDANVYRSDKLDEIAKNLVGLMLDKMNSLKAQMGCYRMWRAMIKAGQRIAAKYGIERGPGIDIGYFDVSRNIRPDLTELTNQLYEDSLYFKHGITTADIDQFVSAMDLVDDVFDVITIPAISKFFE